MTDSQFNRLIDRLDEAHDRRGWGNVWLFIIALSCVGMCYALEGAVKLGKAFAQHYGVPLP